MTKIKKDNPWDNKYSTCLNDKNLLDNLRKTYHELTSSDGGDTMLTGTIETKFSDTIMGMNAVILYESLDGKDPIYLEQAPSGYPIISPFEYVSPRVTHRLYTEHRYYNFGYPRGHWPSICKTLLELMASDNVGKIWYMSDYDIDDGSLHNDLTLRELCELCDMYIDREGEQ